jgi:murein L,D-transpeptidase YcbB/YkuD
MHKVTRTSLLALLAAAPLASFTPHSAALAQGDAAQAGAAQASWSADRATQLLAYVEQVGGDGLSPASYSPERLRAAMGDDAARSRVADEIFLKLAADLSGGSVRGAARVSWYMAPSGADDSERQRLLQQAKRGDVAQVLNGLLPKHPQYALLKNALTKPENAARRDLIRTNMERWRWLPRNLGERHIIVNVPAYTAAIVENGEVIARHKTVVGALKTPTPQLSATVTAVTFNPWWTVPQSIVRTMSGFGGYEVRQGNGYRIVRQPPGPRNALGRIKIEMPNEHAIYLHDTPSQNLFNQERRAYSHGCIRTHNIRGFAETLLAPTGQWNRGKIDQAINTGKTQQARLAAPIPVYIAYFTAAATADGSLVTYADIYGRDGRVRQALNRGPTDRSLASGS